MKKIENLRNRYFLIGGFVLFVFVGFFLGSIYGPKIMGIVHKTLNYSKSSSVKNIHLNPDVTLQKKNIKYVPFELMTSKRIFEEISKNKDITLSVYVRNLDNGPWFGIGENDAFAPIRTLKMPVFIAYLKWSEKNPNVLSKMISLTPTASNDDGTSLLPKNKLKLNQSYSVRKLLEEMMIRSNDVAMDALIKNIPYSFLTQIDTDLGVLLPGEEDIQDFISLKEYSSFFRILYNASYLSPATSEYALSLLSQTDFPDGIRRGVPSNIDIANKFGEKTYTNDLGEKTYQVHDCGIVYYTQYPYIICISVKGPDVSKLPKIIGQTSDIVFEEISKSYP